MEKAEAMGDVSRFKNLVKSLKRNHIRLDSSEFTISKFLVIQSVLKSVFRHFSLSLSQSLFSKIISLSLNSFQFSKTHETSNTRKCLKTRFLFSQCSSQMPQSYQRFSCFILFFVRSIGFFSHIHQK
jgi:hypothetical protein